MEKKLIEINSKNLLFNYGYYVKNTCKDIIAVVKDNAYGHGVKQVIEILDKVNVKMYAVSSISEAIEASKYTKKDLLILDKVNEFNLVTKQMILTVISKDHLQEMIDSEYTLRLHLKINTGMNRKGILPSEFNECKNIIESNPKLTLEGVYTHYASNKAYNLEKQFICFKSLIKDLDRNKYLLHASSSASSLLLKENLTNAVRIGIGLYGLNHRHSVMKETRPVLSLYSYVDKCTLVEKNTKVGYDYKFKTPSLGYLVLSPLGYGSGYLIKNNYYAFYKGEYLKQMCRVCMDYCIYFSSKPIKVGEKIEILGEHVKVDDIARKNKCSSYEMVTLLNKNIKRIII